MRVAIISKKMKNPGGNNPTYWVALKLAAEGVRDPGLYNATFLGLKRSRDPPLPTDRKILEFAASIKTNKKNFILWTNEKKRKNSLDLFQLEIINSNLIK